MTSNIFVLFLVFLTFYNDYVVCNTDDKDPSQVGPVKTVFDLRRFKKDNYIISKSGEEPFSYKVIPKEGTLISMVKLFNITVWKTPDSWSVESIVIMTNQNNPNYFVIKVMDPTNVATLMHFIFLNDLMHTSLVENIHSTNIQVFGDYVTIDDVFDISSEFDLIYHDVKEEISGDKTLKNITIKPISGKFSSVVDNLTILHSEINSWVESMILSKVNGENKLLVLDLVDSQEDKSMKYLFNNGESWEVKDEAEYNEIYGENNLEQATDVVEVVQVEESTQFDLLLSNNVAEMNRNKFTYATLKTMIYFFKKLDSISEGPNEITSEPMFNPVVYVYRGDHSWQYIEILHKTSENDFSNKVNCYYIKEQGVWNKATQAEFFSKIKQQILYRLPALKAPREHINMIEQIELEDNVERTVTETLPFAVKVPAMPAGQTPPGDQNKKPGMSAGGAGGDSSGRAPPIQMAGGRRPGNGNHNLQNPDPTTGGGSPDDTGKPRDDQTEDDETSDFRVGSIMFLLVISLLVY